MVREIPQFEAVICAGRWRGDHECTGTTQISETKGSGHHARFFVFMRPVSANLG